MVATIHREWPGLADPHARVEDGIQRIDDDVGRHDEERRDQDDSDDDREVLHADGLHHALTEPGQPEDGLGDDRAAQTVARSMPNCVMIGVSELRSAWRYTTRRSLKPLARAVRM